MIQVKVLVRTVPSFFMFDSERYVATDIYIYMFICIYTLLNTELGTYLHSIYFASDRF